VSAGRDPTGPPRDQRARALALGSVVLAGACWAIAAVIAKTAFDRGVSPVRMAEARVAVALVFLAGILAVRRPDLLRPPRRAVTSLVAFGVSIAGVNASYYIAIDRLPVGVAISLQYTAPVLLLGLGALAARRRPARLAWVAVAATLLGAVLVSQALSGLEGISPSGALAGVASAGFFAMYLTTAQLAGRRGAEPATVLVWGFVFSIVVWTAVAPWWSWPYDRLSSAAVAAAVVGVGLVGTLLPFLLAVRAVRVLSPATAGIAATAEPPFAAAFAWILLGERLSAEQVLGAALVVAGVVMAQRVAAMEETTLALEPAS
jgi:drug/metabolite transporter (DMT)-like permease